MNMFVQSLQNTAVLVARIMEKKTKYIQDREGLRLPCVQ